MRTIANLIHATLLAGALALSTGAANAAEDEGIIAAVDAETLTITLQNGNSYKLSAEIDVESLQVGSDVVLAYDVVGKDKLVTDLVIYE